MDNNLHSFKWQGIDSGGNRIKGTIKAVDINAAHNEVINQGIEIIDIYAATELKNITIWKQKIKSKEIADFSRFLSTMISAGIPIINSFDIILKDQKNDHFKQIIQMVKHDVTAGLSLSSSFKKYPDVFSSLYCNLVLAGEKSGTLEKIFKKLADHLEDIEKLKSKAIRAMIYPTMIIFVCISVSLILLVFVVPKFESIFKSANAQLPAFTQLVINMSSGIRSHFLFIAFLVFVFIYSIKYFLKTNEKFRDYFDRLVLKIWIIGDVSKKITIARFTNTLAITLEAGLPIVDSMNAMANIMTNAVFKKHFLQTAKELSQGRSLSASLSEFDLMPVFLVQMITVGESSGRLPEMLNRVSVYYEDDVNHLIENLGNIVEPLVIVVLGIIVGAFVIAMYLPIFKLGSVVSGH